MATHYVYHPIAEATVNGRRRKLLPGCRTQVGFGQGTSSATLVFDPAEGRIFGGDHVVAKFGYTETGIEVCFTGQVQQDTIKTGPTTLSCTAVGPLSRLSRTIGEPDLPGTTDPDGQPIPAISWDSNPTDAQIIADVLARYGITGAVLAGANVIDTSAGPVFLTKDQTGLSLVQGLDQAYWLRTFDGADGVVRRVAINGVPSGSPQLTFTEGVDIGQGAQRQRDTQAIVNRVNAAGPANDAFTPQATIQADSAIDPATGEPLIPDPPKYVAQNFTSDYLRTEAACANYGTQTIGAQNRYLETLTLPLAKGNAGILPGMSCVVVSASLDLDATVLWLVQDVLHDFGAQGFQTSLNLLGAYAGDGVNPNQAPTANVIYTTVLQYVDGTAQWVVFADGSGSFDPEDAYDIPAVPADPGDPSATPPRDAHPATPEIHFNGIAAYTWGGSLGTPTVSDGGKHAVYVTTTDPTGKTISLTVFDSEGLTGTTTLTIDTTATPPKMRDLWSAEGTELAFSSDGGKTWADITPAIPAVGCARAAAATYQLAYTGAGVLWRVTTDLAPTSPTGPANVTACSIRWKYPESEPAGVRAWLGCANGDIWRSDDSGNTFAKLATVPNGHTVVWVEESPFADNDAVALAGDTLYHSFDGTAWTAMYQDPDGLAAAAYAAGFGEAFVIFNGALVAGEVSRVHERDDLVAGNWNGDAGSGPVDEPGAQPRALTIGVYTPTLIAGGTAPDGTEQVWTAADASEPFTFARATYDEIIFGQLRDLIRDGQFDGLVYGQAANGLFKTDDNFASTIYRVRDYATLGGGRSGYMVGYGKLRDAVTTTAAGALTALATALPSSSIISLVRLTPTGWVKLSDLPALPAAPAGTQPWHLLRAAPGVYIAWSGGTATDGTQATYSAWANALISTDDGATWNALSLTGIQSLDATPTGVLYALRLTNAGTRGGYVDEAVYRSTDHGATWAKITADAVLYRYGDAIDIQTNIVAGPGDDDVFVRIETLAAKGIQHSTDSGATFGAAHSTGMAGSITNYWPFALTPARTGLVAWGNGGALWRQPLDADGAATASGVGSIYDAIGSNQVGDKGFFVAGADAYFCAGPNQVWRSTDDGASWSSLAIPSGYNVTAVLDDPASDDLFLCAQPATGAATPGGDGSGTYPWAHFWLRWPAGADPATGLVDLTAAMTATLGATYRVVACCATL